MLLVRAALERGDDERTTPTVTVATQPSRTQAEPPPATTSRQPAEFYTVQAGDTLASIADEYGTTVDELLSLNPGVDPVERSTVGQRIRVQ